MVLRFWLSFSEATSVLTFLLNNSRISWGKLSTGPCTIFTTLILYQNNYVEAARVKHTFWSYPDFHPKDSKLEFSKDTPWRCSILYCVAFLFHMLRVVTDVHSNSLEYHKLVFWRHVGLGELSVINVIKLNCTTVKQVSLFAWSFCGSLYRPLVIILQSFKSIPQ